MSRFVRPCLQPITDDDVDRIATCLRVLAEQSPLMSEIYNHASRNSVSLMLAAKMEEEKQAQQVWKTYLAGGLFPSVLDNVYFAEDKLEQVSLY